MPSSLSESLRVNVDSSSANWSSSSSSWSSSSFSSSDSGVVSLEVVSEEDSKICVKISKHFLQENILLVFINYLVIWPWYSLVPSGKNESSLDISNLIGHPSDKTGKEALGQHLLKITQERQSNRSQRLSTFSPATLKQNRLSISTPPFSTNCCLPVPKRWNMYVSFTSK